MTRELWAGLPNVISLGAGVQSSTMALMAAVGEITPMPIAAIFADTQAEPQGVYRWLDWLEPQLPYPVHRVTYGNLAEDALKLHTSKKSGKLYSKGGIPVFMQKPSGGKGLMWRRCTSDYKIEVIHRKLKELLGIKRATSAFPLVTQWIGISIDEEKRAKPPRQSWIVNRWPLLELGIDRQDCFDWMTKRGFPAPPRSACVFCPYHSDAEWLRLKTEEPEEFAKAVEWERRYQAAVAADEVTEGTPFLHDSLVQIDKVEFNIDKYQIHEECEGMCGV